MDPLTEACALANQYPFWQIPGAELVETAHGTRIRIPLAGSPIPWYCILPGCPKERAWLTTPRRLRPREERQAEVRTALTVWGCVAATFAGVVLGLLVWMVGR